MDSWPKVVCLCPTYGRLTRLKDAIACFLMQDYPGEKLLLVLNDAKQSINVEGCDQVVVTNCDVQYETLGHKRNALLEHALYPVIAHWDDDDLYLPWHLSMCVEELMQSGKWCTKPNGAYYAVGPRGKFTFHGNVHHNVFEGQMVFLREQAVLVGGYTLKASGQAKDLQDAFKKCGRLHVFNPTPFHSYIYRWGDQVGHVSAAGGDKTTTFAEKNMDFGDGTSLVIEDPTAWARHQMASQYALIIRQLVGQGNPVAAARLVEALDDRSHTGQE